MQIYSLGCTQSHVQAIWDVIFDWVGTCVCFSLYSHTCTFEEILFGEFVLHADFLRDLKASRQLEGGCV